MAVTRKRVCITGGAGFIGSYLVQHLIEDNEVVVYDNLHRNAIQFAHVEGHPHLHLIKGDVMDYDATRRAVEGCQVVIHCAAIAGVYSVDRNAVTTMEVNLLGTHQVVKAALAVGVERFVEFSTSEVYGPFIHKGKEDDLTTIGPIGESRWIYAASKLASEHLSYAHYKEDGLPLAIVRPFNVYGPRQVGDGAIRGIVIQALTGTTAVMIITGIVAMTSGINFAALAPILLIALLGLIVVGLVGIFVKFSRTVNMVYSIIGMLVFSGFFLLKFFRLSQSENTWERAIDATVGIYVTFVNFFLYLLQFLMSSRRR